MSSDDDAAEESKGEDSEPKRSSADSVSVTRRNLLRASLVMGLVFVIGGVASLAKSVFSPANPPSPEAVQTTTPTVTQTVTVTQQSGSQTASVSTSSSATATTTSTSSSPFPQVLITNVSDMVVSQPVEFNYPLDETPNILVKLGVKSVGGVGPDGDIVAFSQICQHLGCIWGFVAPGTSPGCNTSFSSSTPSAYCCCHGSTYDLTNAGKVTGGPAPRPVPQVTLEVDSSGNIYAVGMGPPTIFGHDTGSNNVLEDLQGGTLVSGS